MDRNPMPTNPSKKRKIEQTTLTQTMSNNSGYNRVSQSISGVSAKHCVNISQVITGSSPNGNISQSISNVSSDDSIVNCYQACDATPNKRSQDQIVKSQIKLDGHTMCVRINGKDYKANESIDVVNGQITIDRVEK